MGDLFHEDVPADFVARAFATMDAAHRHTFQVLTKRSGRLAALAPDLPWPGNVWAGVSVEAADYVHRIDDPRSVPAAVRFLSLELLLGPLPKRNLTGIDWVIVGGESGPGARPVDPDWVREISDQCLSAGVALFFKHWGGTRKKAAGRLLDGRVWDAMPSARSQAGVAAAI
jgi:protein gp37